MEQSMNMNEHRNRNIWIGVAIGAAIGIGLLARRRRASRWDDAREMTRKMKDNSGELVEAGKNIIDRVRVIYDEARKVAEEAGELWVHGRKLVGH